MNTAKQKGDALEAAVEAIEGVILQHSPATKGKTHVIESKKVVETGGVRHEIDLFVTCEIAPGYKAIFIFECKNWKDDVPKNEIIVFSEKIDVCSAQRGFFVAKSFTSDAVAQAAKDPRITLRQVTEHDPSIAPFGFHYTVNERGKTQVHLKQRGAGERDPQRIDISQAVILLNGSPLDLPKYLEEWSVAAINESSRTFPSGTLPDGKYPRQCHAVREFSERQLTVDGRDIESVSIDVEFDTYIKRPPVISHFEVGGRGRVVTFGGYTQGHVEFSATQIIVGSG